MRFYIALIVCFLGFLSANGKAGFVFQQADSLKELNADQFMELVLKYHPVAKQAGLLSDMARAEIRMARGQFDPKMNAVASQKALNGKVNYTDWDTYISVPTWYGADFKAGWERNIGLYVNPEGATPVGGLAFLGVSVPLGQGMFFDQRRAAVLQAKQLKSLNEAERVKVINKLILQASKDYYDWYYTWRELEISRQGFNFAKERFLGVKARAAVGEVASIDTVEAKITFQDRDIAVKQAEVNYKNASFLISNYLWNESSEPMEVSRLVRPELPKLKMISAIVLDSLRFMAENGHPEIIKIRTKGIQLSLEKKLASEQLKPTLNLSYNVLDYLPIVSSEYQPNYFANNYKIGAAFSLPLFLRKERGKLKLTSLKIEQNDWEAKQTNREIQNQIRAVYQVLENMSKMIVTQNEMVINYSLLRDAELDKFSIGESSLFLVNSRETKLLEALLKQRDLERKIYKAEAELYWAAGVGRNFRQ